MEQIALKKSIKFLGVYIDEFLTWKHHIGQINSKVARALFTINQLKHLLPGNTLKTLYFALINPHLLYGILAWGNAKISLLGKTITLQKRAVRTISMSAYNSHTDPLFRKLEILKVKDLYIAQVALFMFDYTQNMLPISFRSLFKYNHEIQKRTTRQSHLLHISKCHVNFSSNLPLYAFPKIWNKHVDQGQHAPSRSIFKSKHKQLYINSYSKTVKCKNKYCKDCRR